MSSESARKVNWQTIAEIKSNVLNMSVSCHALTKPYIKKALDIDYEFKSAYYFDNTIAYSDEDLGNFFRLIQDKLKKGQYFFTFPERVYKLANSLLNYSKRLQTISNLTDKPNPEIHRMFLEFIERMATAWPLLMILAPIEIIVTGELEQYIRKQLGEEKLKRSYEEYFQALTQRSAKETYFQKDHRDLLEFGREIQRNSMLLKKLESLAPGDFINFIKLNKQTIYKKLLKHNQEFGWLNMNIFRRGPFNIEDQVVRLKDVVRKDCNTQLQSLNVKAAKIEKSFHSAVQELKLTGILKKKVEALGEYVYLRTYRMDIFSLAIYYVRNLLLEIASRHSVSYDEFVQLTIGEISDLILGKINIDKIPLKKRMENFAIIQINGKFRITTGKIELKELLREKRKTRGKKVRIIKGKVASRGRAKGPARIIMHPTQLNKVQKGDVLVAPMTRPEYVVGMLKAIAIVTDQGGITCHAAIVSRELGIPCIVGTQRATQLLHDGYLVEVDAIKGEVRILNPQ